MKTVLRLIDCGRQKMIDSGNLHQWTNGHPGKKQIESDIMNGNSYLIVADEEKPIATFAFIKGFDPTYARIEGGHWLNHEAYGTLHRVASIPGTKGIMDTIVDYCFRKVENIRIDTHQDNLPMQRALKRLGFAYCGIIYLENGDPRVAFQKKR